MTPVEIRDEHSLSYSVFDPVHFPEEMSKKLDLTTRLKFPEKYDYKESVNCQELFADPVNDAHHFGLALKQTIDERRIAAGMSPVIYSGFVIEMAGILRSWCADGATVRIVNSPENGNCAHCDFQIFAPADLPDRKAKIQRLRRAVSDAMREGVIFSHLILFTNNHETPPQ